MAMAERNDERENQLLHLFDKVDELPSDLQKAFGLNLGFLNHRSSTLSADRLRRAETVREETTQGCKVPDSS